MANKTFLINHLNNFVGSGYGFIPRWAFRIYGESEWNCIREWLADWEKSGFLKIVQDPEHSEDNEYCAQMFNFIGASESLPNNWINYERKIPEWIPPTDS